MFKQKYIEKGKYKIIIFDSYFDIYIYNHDYIFKAVDKLLELKIIKIEQKEI